MFDHPGSYQRMYPNFHTTQSTNMPPAPQPSPASGSKKNKIASTYGPNEKATTSNSAARREDQQNPLEPTSQPPSELSKNWTQADHNLLFIFHYLLHNTWKAVGEQLGPIDIQTNVSRNLGTRELFEEVDALNKAYGFRQLSYNSEEIIRDEEMVWDNMMVQVPVRSFPTKVNWGGLAAVAYLEVPLSSKIQLPKSSMTLWDLIGWLTDRIYGNNSRGATEEKAALQEISEWAAKIHGDLDADNKQRRIFLVSLIGKQVKLNSGAYLKLIGMSEDEFVVQDTEGAKYIVGKHVELEDAQPHASV
ncbi:hypothetical protein Alg215_11728 [Pyrenophora tritici-repentis]|nr:hypothetical protein Alg215_11728 [Pyrenophora tritici-repentis]